MKPRITRAGAISVTSALCLAFAPHLSAQAVQNPAAIPPEDEETIILSPFVVEASEDRDSYAATATMAGSRVRTELKDVGSAISVVTNQFLKDTGAVNNETLLQYTVSGEVGGQYGNFAGLGDNKTLDDTNQRMAPHQNTRVRGLAAADNTRDFFLTDIPWDSYNVGRIDIQRGPNAILFGMGSPAGIINHSVNGAAFKTAGNAEFRFGSYGSIRGSLDYNHVLLQDELSIRVSGLHDHTKYRQDPAFNKDRRIYGALRWDPKFLRFEGARTSLNIKYEDGRIRANRPRVLPPGDLITPWWTNPRLIAIREAGGMNPLTVGINDANQLAALRAAGDLGAGIRGDNSNYYYRGVGAFGRNYGGIVAVFADPNSGDHHLMTTDVPKNVTSNILIPWTIMSGVVTRKDLEGSLQTSQNYDFYRDETLRDPSIFDFYNKLLDGPNKREWSNHDALNISLSQTFFDNRLGIEGVIDTQNYDRGQVNLLSEYGQAITIDLNNRLPDGSVNPNYGRATTVSDQYANNSYESKRESKRLTAFAEFRASDYWGNSTLAKVVGRHVLTGLLADEEVDMETRSWTRYAADISYGQEILSDPVLTSRAVNTLNYLSGNIASRDSIQGAGIGNIQAVQIPTSTALRGFSMVWNAPGVNPSDPWVGPNGETTFGNGPLTQAHNPANYVGWAGAPRTIGLISDEAGDRDALTTNAALDRTETSSRAFNWQAYLFDGIVVPSFGARIDRQKAYSLGANLPKRADGSNTVDFGPLYRLPDVPGNIETGRNESWSIVVHTPKRFRDRLWKNTGLSLYYNESSNFRPSAGRIDVMGNPISSPRGETKDIGVVLTTLNDRLTLKINKYETKVKDSTLDGFGGSYMIWGAEAWAYSFGRGNLDRANVGGWADFRNGYNPQGIVAAETPPGGWTADDIAYAQRVGDAITQAYMDTRPSDAFFRLWQIDTASADAGNFVSGTTPSGFAITGDTMSKGWEFELIAQPTKNWNISINAAKTEAQRINMAASLVDYVEERWAVYNTPVMLDGAQVGVIGDLRFWNGGYSPGESLRGKFGREFMSGYYLYRIQEGSNVPELRPWRFNAVTNYNFDSGILRGVNVGGGYRWQDKVVVGYPVLPGASVEDPRAFDLGNPYMGPTEDAVDIWIGYGRKLTRKLDWRIQLNVRNVFAKKELIPVTVQPDGSMAVGRIAEPAVWTVSNTITF